MDRIGVITPSLKLKNYLLSELSQKYKKVEYFNNYFEILLDSQKTDILNSTSACFVDSYMPTIFGPESVKK